MKQPLLFLFAVISFSVMLTSCKKDNNKDPETETSNTALQIAVKDGNSWTAAGVALNTVSGATVTVYASLDSIANNKPAYSKATDQTGIALIPVQYRSEYYYTVQKDNARNIYNNLLIAAIFETNEEIQNAAIQAPTPTVGSPQFADLNQDGIINSSDNTSGKRIVPITDDTVSVSSIIYK